MLEPVLSFVGRGVSLIRPVLVCVSSRAGGKFLLHVPSWNLCVRSASLHLIWGVSLTRPVLETVWSFVGKGDYLTRPGGWGVSLTRPVMKYVLSFVSRGVSLACPLLQFVSSLCDQEFLLDLTRTVLESVSSSVEWGISLTRPVLVFLASVCVSFCYTARGGICRFVRRLRRLS